MSQSAVPIAYILIFCRAAIGLVFALSCLSKARNLAAFSEAIDRFQIVPARWTGPAAYLIVLAEGVVMLDMVLGGRWLVPGFALGLGLLIVFSAAMLRALSRRMQVSCTCFGRTDRPVSFADVGRNSIFVIVSGAGLLIAGVAPAALSAPTSGEAGLMILIGATVVAVALHLHDLVQLYGSALEHTS